MKIREHFYIAHPNIPQPEGELGGFDKSLLDQFDDTLAAIHHLSKGVSSLMLLPESTV